MTRILVGDRGVALAMLGELTPQRRIARDPQDTRSAKDVNSEAYGIWQERNREHILWINPHPGWNPKHLQPHPGRHLFFEGMTAKGLGDAGKITTEWKAWARLHGIVPELASLPTREARIKLLTSGATGLRFTRQAAELLVDSHPGGYDALSMPVTALQLMGRTSPVGPTEVLKVTLAPELDVIPLLARKLGTRESLELARQIPPKQVIPALHYLNASCRNRPERLEYLQDIFEGIRDRRWKPWMAFQLFVHLCYQEETTCPSRSKRDASSSRTPPAIFRISAIP